MRGLAAACVLAGVAGSAAARPGVAMRKGPYLQDLGPASVTIMWQLEPAQPARLIVDGPGGERAQEVPAAPIAEAHVTGLQPSSRYRYRVVAGDQAWEGELATAPPAGKDAPFTFTVVGDSRYGVEQHRRLAERMALDAPAFVLGTGDLVDDGARHEQWQQFFDAAGPLLRRHAYYPAVGNHDRQGRGRTTEAYGAYFAVPDSGSERERYYAFTYGATRVLVLDSNIDSFALTDQTAWLERELIAARQDADVRHIFAVMHHPPFSVSLHGGAPDLRERWAPLFERFAVSAVFSGHDHVYTRAEHHGVRYFVSGGGGAPLYPRRKKPRALDAAAVQHFERSHHYLRVAVTGRRVEVAAIRSDGTAIETTVWADAVLPVPPRRPAGVAIGGPPPAAAPPLAAAPARAPWGWIGFVGVGLLLATAVVLVRTLRGP